MRLDDINALVDAARVYDRAHKRIVGEDFDKTVYLRSMGDFMEVARVTDTSIDRVPLDGGVSHFSIGSRGVRFCYNGTEVE